MAASASAAFAAPHPSPIIRAAALAIVICYAGALASAALHGSFLWNAAGDAIASDFVGVWSGGRLALEGRAADAYDWDILKQVQVAGVGAPFDGAFGWNYPPTFFFVVTPLALLGCVAGHLAYMAATLPPYLAAVRAIAPGRGVALAALAFPAGFWNIVCGQNGFLTAALFGGGLALLNRRPLAAGVLFGLMTYKPQFGVLIPIALVAGCHWRTIAAACATAAALAAASALTFGFEAWTAFLESIAVTNQKVLVAGGVGFSELLSLYGVTRWLGAEFTPAAAAQAGLALAMAALVWRSWRSDMPDDVKCALLATAALMTSPYVLIYDLVLLAIPIAFLARRGLDANERALVGAACFCIVAGPLLDFPYPTLAAPIVLGVVLRRAFAAHDGTEPAGDAALAGRAQ